MSRARMSHDPTFGEWKPTFACRCAVYGVGGSCHTRDGRHSAQLQGSPQGLRFVWVPRTPVCCPLKTLSRAVTANINLEIDRVSGN